MRIDLFLKVAGLLKTRSIAGKAISSGAVAVNGKRVKASAAVKEDDTIQLVKPDGETLTIQVLEIPASKSVSRKDRTSLYSIIERSPSECF